MFDPQLDRDEPLFTPYNPSPSSNAICSNFIHSASLIIMSSDWKTVNSKVVYKNPFMAIREDTVIRPNGTTGSFYVLDRSCFSIIIPLTPDFEIYLVGQYRYALQTFTWEFPMGSVAGKSHLEIAKQELKEETGLTAKHWVKIGEYAVSPGHASQKTQLFVATDLTQGKSNPEPNEFLTVKKIPLAQLEEWISHGTIIDGVTIAAFHLLEVYLKSSELRIKN